MSDHTPDAEGVFPEDIWGDPEALEADLQGTILPPKRVREENHAPGADQGGMGLRIGGWLAEYAASTEPPSFEVQEISGTVVRLDPETAAEPWAERQINFQQRPAGAEPRRGAAGETREWGRSRKQPVIWMVASGGAVLAMVILALVMLPSIDKSISASPRPGDIELVLEQDGMNAEALAIKSMLDHQKEAEEIFRALVTAPSVPDILPSLRDVDEIAGLIQADPHLIGSFINQAPPKTEHWTARHSDGLTYGLLKGTLPDYSGFEAYFVLQDDKLVLDWKASSAFGTANFGELAQKRGNPSEIRSWVSNAGFYTLAFPEDEFQCHQLLSPDKKQSVWAYSRRGSDVESLINTRLKSGYTLQNETESMKATFRLEAGPAEALPNQWLIGELLHKDWIAP